MRRILTRDEIDHAYKIELLRQQRLYPAHEIEVLVNHDTDDNGQPVSHIIVQRQYTRKAA